MVLNHSEYQKVNKTAMLEIPQKNDQVQVMNATYYTDHFRDSIRWC